MRAIGILMRSSSLALVLTLAHPALAVDVFSVTNFGSPQAAIDAAEAAGGGLVRFPCDTITLLTGLVVDDAGVTLEGCGPGGTELRAAFASGNIISLGDPSDRYSPCGGVRDLSITSSVARTGGYAIAIAGCEQGVIENLRIETQGGNGIRFGNGNNELASIFQVRSIDIEVHGAFTAIQIDGASDRYFSDLWLRGDRSNGSRGIVITESGGDWFKDIEAVLFEIGIDIVPDSSQTVAWGHFNNVLADTNTLYGFRFGNSGSGSILGISCLRCWASTNGISTLHGRGIIVNRGSGLSFMDSRIINNGGHGFEVNRTASDIHISGGIFTGNCIAANCRTGFAHGITMDTVNGFRIEGVRSGQTVGQGNKQGFGIFINNGSNNYIVTNNDLRSNVIGGIRNAPGLPLTRMVLSNL